MSPDSLLKSVSDVSRQLQEPKASKAPSQSTATAQRLRVIASPRYFANTTCSLTSIPSALTTSFMRLKLADA